VSVLVPKRHLGVAVAWPAVRLVAHSNSADAGVWQWCAVPGVGGDRVVRGERVGCPGRVHVRRLDYEFPVLSAVWRWDDDIHSHSELHQHQWLLCVWPTDACRDVQHTIMQCGLRAGPVVSMVRLPSRRRRDADAHCCDSRFA
jgi:hypothetical protein